LISERFGDPRVQLLPYAAKQAAMRRVFHQRVRAAELFPALPQYAMEGAGREGERAAILRGSWQRRRKNEAVPT
jgi:hypothetical protein